MIHDGEIRDKASDEMIIMVVRYMADQMIIMMVV